MIDRDRLAKTLLELLAIPSPSGFTDEVVRYVCYQLDELGVEYELTRRGTIRAYLPGTFSNPARAIITHLDNIGAMVRRVTENGRVLVAPIGHWSSRFAEGARVTIFSENGAYRGCLLPRVDWNVSRDEGVSEVPISWDEIELRIEEPVFSAEDVTALGINIGDFIALDSNPEILDNGYVVGRTLDNKAGVAAVLAFIARLVKNALTPANDLHVLFTISETTGGGIGGAVLPEVSELVTVDFESLDAVEKSPFRRVTLASGDASGPYDFHLTAHLRALAADNEIPLQQKYLKAFHSDAAAALVAGHDVRTAVLAYAGDATHSLERTHLDSLVNVARLLEAYSINAPTFEHDTSVKQVDGFSRQIDSAQLPHAQPLPDAAEIIRKGQVDIEPDGEG